MTGYMWASIRSQPLGKPLMFTLPADQQPSAALGLFMLVIINAGESLLPANAEATLSAAQNTSRSCNSTEADLYIITPVSRFKRKEELVRIAVSIRWDCVTQWILVYDTERQHDLEPLFSESPKVTEIFFHAEEGAGFGNMQRNRGIDKVMQGLVYFLDDDNIMHAHFWDILPDITLGHITTFDEVRMEDNPPRVLEGETISVGSIDTAMYVIDRALFGETRWHQNDLAADAMFVAEIFGNHTDKHVYIPGVAAYHNGLVIPERRL